MDDAAENGWIYTTFGHFGGVNRNLWIGLHDPDPSVNSPVRATRRLELRALRAIRGGLGGSAAGVAREGEAIDVLPVEEVVRRILRLE